MTTTYDLSGKVALVTGATGIFGRPFCGALAAAGASVCVVDLDRTTCESFAAELTKKSGVAARGFACDITKPAEVQETVAAVVAAMGAINILHNNAATKSSNVDAFFAPFESYSLETWREVMAVNIDGMFLVAQAVGRQMIAQKSGGSVIQTASIYGVTAPDQRIYQGSLYNGHSINTPAVYSASKSAVIGLSQYLATYWASHKIRVNTLTPGGVESGQNAEFISRYSERVPLGRMGKPDELTGALLYLASDASSYVTGQNLIVDGGMSAW